jgi:hypothetical protein
MKRKFASILATAAKEAFIFAPKSGSPQADGTIVVSC